MRLIELSHVVSSGMVTYPGLPAPEIVEHLSFEDSRAHYGEGTEFTIGRISMVANTGTYLDTPAHRHRDGYDLSQLPLQRCAMLPAVVVNAEEDQEVGLDRLSGLDVAGAAILLRTGWDRHWGTERYGEPQHPYLAVTAAEWLVHHDVALVGIDSVNIDATVSGERPVHSALLGAGIPIVEHLTGLDMLPASGATFTATPVAVAGLATFPVRAFAAIQ